MSLEQTIKDTLLSESVDLDARLQQLVRAGLMPANTIPILRKAIVKVQGGMVLQGAERDVMANFLNSMMFIVLGDDSIFNRAKVGAKKYAAEETDLEEARGSDYTLYHKSYTDAINHALSHHEKSGLKVSDDDRFQHVAVGSKKPSEGNTTSLHIPATHSSGKKHMLHVQVFNKGGTHPYELNTYSSGMGRQVKEEAEQIDELNAGIVRKAGQSRTLRKLVPGLGKNEAGERAKDNKFNASLLGQSKPTYYDGTTNPDHKSEKAEAGRSARAAKRYNKIAKEEVEQIDEISDKTKSSYADKASKFINNNAHSMDSATVKKWNRRQKGMNRLRKEEAKADIAAFTQMNESYKTTFHAALEQYGIKSPSELDEEKRKEFFNFVDQNYKKGDN